LGTGVEEYGSISLLVKEVVGDGANIFFFKAESGGNFPVEAYIF
jgi:hypothetical protein